VAFAFTAIPARYALERRRWDEAANLTLPPGALGAFPWQRFRWAESHIYFARAVGAARAGDTASARQDVAKLAALQQALVEVKGDYDWARQVDIQRQAAAAWVAHAEGKNEEALQLMRGAADLEDATDKHPVTPGAILPAREMLGDLLRELNHPALALREYETALVSAPKRFNSIFGAARSAELSGEQKRARAYYEQLVALGNQSDGSRPELQQAKMYLSRR
jgi:tetratricopeptide (TPR) repeat protein